MTKINLLRSASNYLCINFSKKENIMTITDDKKLLDIQREFYDKFPYLKLEFYKSKHGTGEGSSNQELINPNQTIGEVRTIHTKGDLSINGHIKVATLEKNFSEQYGLNVQVWRRSGDIWLQTTVTDSWTLTDQNEKGKASAIHPA